MIWSWWSYLFGILTVVVPVAGIIAWCAYMPDNNEPNTPEEDKWLWPLN